MGSGIDSELPDIDFAVKINGIKALSDGIYLRQPKILDVRRSSLRSVRLIPSNFRCMSANVIKNS
jgi:hypothetical protein